MAVQLELRGVRAARRTEEEQENATVPHRYQEPQKGLEEEVRNVTSKMKIALLATALLLLGSASGSFAMMGGWNGWTGGCGWTGGRGGMMTNAGGFGMMNGLAASPVVGPDGTAYLVSTVPSATLGTSPSWKSFQSNIIAVSPAGQILKLTLDGMISRPVIDATSLIATASLPNNGNYLIMANHATAAAQSAIFWLDLPLSATILPPPDNLG